MTYLDGWWIPWPPHPNDLRHPVLSQISETAQIPFALRYPHREQLVLQAGARCGLWPLMLADHFARVIAFEADPLNFACARMNCRRRASVEIYHEALGPTVGSVSLVSSSRSSGEHYVYTPARVAKLTQTVPMTTIDALKLPACDAIFLDVEGFELAVMHGAARTLEQFRPLLVLEENSTCERYAVAEGDLSAWLARFGYQVVDRFTTAAAEQIVPGAFQGADLVLVAG